MKYTSQDVFKVAYQIGHIEEDGNAVDIKLKQNTNPDHFRETLIELGVPEENISNNTLKYTHTHKDYTWSVMSRKGGHPTEISEFFDKVELQTKRIKLINELFKNGGTLNASEQNYLKGLTTLATNTQSKTKQ